MNKVLGILCFIFSFSVFADCDLSVQVERQDYCVQVDWLNTEQKVGGVFQEGSEQSPYFITMGTVPAQWQYSRATVSLWKKEDAQKTLQHVPSFRVFPYMMMEGGHHHGASYQWSWDSSSQKYILSRMALHSMKGEWTLRWTLDKQNNFDASELLLENISQTF